MGLKTKLKQNAAVQVVLHSTPYLYARGLKVARRKMKEFGYPERIKTIWDMLETKRRFDFTYAEYCLYHFENRSIPQRLEFIADIDHLKYTSMLNNPDNQILFDDKERTYELFSPYYKRELIGFDVSRGAEDQEKLKGFLGRHSRFIVKPSDGCCGQGVKIYDLPNDFDMDAIVRELCAYGKCVLEEVVEQCEELRKFHPKSLNTVRLTTVRYDDHVDVIHPFIRFGQRDSIVDNAGAGGVVCPIDPATGITMRAGDEFGHTYTVHPDTGYCVVGLQIPRWEEAVAMVKELAQIIPDNHYTGWDLALRDDGWVMIEGNARGQFVGWQIPNQEGFRRELQAISEALNIGHVESLEEVYLRGMKRPLR